MSAKFNKFNIMSLINENSQEDENLEILVYENTQEEDENLEILVYENTQEEDLDEDLIIGNIGGKL